MGEDGYPRQVDFKATSEEWGTVRLSDGAEASTRVIMSDLVLAGEDVLGPKVAYSHIVALRVKSPPDVKNAVKDKPFSPQSEIVPLTKEAGYEALEIVERIAPTRSIYRFDEYEFTLELETIGAAKNMRYKTPSGCPLYNLRWTVRKTTKKVPVSK